MPRTLPFRLRTALLLCLSTSWAAAQTTLTVQTAQTRLTFPGDHFELALPIAHNGPAAEAQVTADLLDTNNAVLSHATIPCRLDQPTTLCRVPMPSAMESPRQSNPGNDLIPLYRLRYTVTVPNGPGASGILALTSIAPDLFELHVATAKAIHTGATYTARVRALHPLTHAPRAGVVLEARLNVSSVANYPEDPPFALVQAVTDAEGFASIPFTIPTDRSLTSVDLDIRGSLGNLHPFTTQTLEVPSARIFQLTTDKPLYQPGQTLHTRLLLAGPTGRVTPNAKIRLDVSDPNNILVFRAETVTSTYGIASLDWPIPARMRLGDYQLRATTLGGPDDDQTAYTSVHISGYDLPTFVVSPKPDRPFYLPGQNATVEIRADYLFGKPVLHGHVRVVREQDRTWNFLKQRFDTTEGQSFSGALDAHGVFHAVVPLTADLKQFSRSLPSNDFTDLHYAAYVTDSTTGRTEQRRFDLRVSSQALHITLTPVDRVHGLPTSLRAAVTTADGLPASCDLTLALLPFAPATDSSSNPLPSRIRRAIPLQHIHTDANGLARITLPSYADLLKQAPPPSSADPDDAQPTLYVTARDTASRTGANTQQIPPDTSTLRITTPNSIYRPGDPVVVSLDSAEPTLPVTLQLLRRTLHGDLTLATRDLVLTRGHASVTFPTDARFTGLVFIHALSIAAQPTEKENDDYTQHDSHSSTASRALLFPRDNTLHVGIQMSATTYKPGDTATAALSLRGPQDPDGDDPTPAPSALGLVAVDQAVAERNRTDNDFGNSGSSPFFFRESGEFSGEFSGSVGGFTLQSLNQLDPTQPIPPGAQLAAEALLDGRNLRFDLANTQPGEDLASIFRILLDGQLSPARVALARYLDTHTELPTTPSELAPILAPKNIDLTALRDPWDTYYTLTATPDSYGTLNLTLHSAGPDKQPNTPDDFDVPLATWHWFNGRQRQLQHAVDAFHQRTGTYIRSLADLRAEMLAEAIPFDKWRDPWNQPFTYTFSVQQASFTLEATTPGDPLHKPRYAWERGPRIVGTASIPYTAELQIRIREALDRYAATHPFPRTQTQVLAVLHAAGITPAQLTDPWHHPFLFTTRSHSFFSDRVRTEVHATPTTAPEARTIVTPVTALSDLVDLRSLGRDGRPNTPDDFLIATFSHIRTQQSALESTARRVPHPPVLTGPTGTLSGTVTDPTGATIPNATVIAKDAATGTEFEQHTDADGHFLLGPIPVGSYTLHIQSPGFQDFIYDKVQVLERNTITLDATLRLGSVSEAVEVSASTVTLETNSASVAVSRGMSGMIMDQKVMALPMMARAAGGGPAPTPRLRDYFPETLLWRPEILTAPDGTSTLKFPVADNITTWQLFASASTLQGNTGSGVTSFTTFQPFFAAFDPPSILTTGDTISLPIPLRNYLDHPLTVRASLKPAPWFRLEGPPSLSATIPSQQSVSPILRFTATTPVTEAKQEFTAQSTGETGDRIARPVTVHPQGHESALTSSAILSPGPNQITLTLPADLIPNSTLTTLKLYPNLASHLRDALVSMSSYPNGCAEQILSIAWPSLLLQRYAASLPAPDKALQLQTHTYLEQAYANLLANQLPSGGFAYWTSDPNADLALTAYAVQFLTQARAYITIDDAVLTKAVSFLSNHQSPTGLWIRFDRDQKPHPEDTHANAMLTASIASMLAGAPASEPLLRKALTATRAFTAEFDEPYTLASYALAALALNDTTTAAPALQRLRTLALSENGGAFWSLETNTPFFGWGRAGRVEATAQVLRALLAAGAKPGDDLIARGLLFLDHQQDRQSLWYSTQATARVLDVLASIALRTPALTTPNPGAIHIRVDETQTKDVPLPPANQDAGPLYVVLAEALTPGPHQVHLDLPPNAQSATAQLVTTLYQPWPAASKALATNNEQLRLNVSFSTTKPTPAQTVEATAHIERLGFRGYGMLIAEIGLPPGADVDRASLESALNGQVNHYEVLPDKVLVYLWPRAGGVALHFRFALRYAVDALAAPSSVYDYYNPDARLDLPPARFTTR